MIDTTSPTEKSTSLLSKLSFLKLKKVWIPIILCIELFYYWYVGFTLDPLVFANFIIINCFVLLFIINILRILERFPFLKLKKVWIPIIILLIAGFFELNFYENENNCSISIIPESPFIGCREHFSNFGCFDGICLDKPLILLYPLHDTQVDVSLEYTPGFSATYPEYDTTKRGWSVLAHPDGTLIDHGTNQDTYGLFWEGNPTPNNYDLSHGFVIKGSELRNFLYAKLTELGLNTKEKSDFIMYWYPKLQEYPYIQITFAGSDYTDTAKLSISPTPDSLLRVFMVVKPLTEYKNIPKQQLQKFQRTGFSVVEWGGTIVQ